ncbi:MAG: hypothetical protein IJC83_02220 [Oscillospiraceae bacterium]|nr:hypothetical protein [Oscillospiraceae bacterium]
MAKLQIDPITGKRIERWNSTTHSFSTAKTTSKIGCDDLYGHSHKTTSREDYIKRANARNAETYRAVKLAQQKTGYKGKSNYQTASKKDGFGIASIVLAIISLISILDSGSFNLICVVLSIVFGAISCKKGKSKFAVAGIVISAITIVIGMVFLFVYIRGGLIAGLMTEILYFLEQF